MRSPLPRALTVLLVCLAGGMIACKRPLGDPKRIGATQAPFERLPYVQAVDSTGAYVVWLARAAARDSFRYRADGSDGWIIAGVIRDTAPLFGAVGELRNRRVRIGDLAPGSRVEYEVWADGSSQGPFAFRIAPRPGSRDTVRLLAFGDSGWGSPNQLRLAALMRLEPWDLAVHTGDIAYENGSDQDFTVRHFQIYQDWMSEVPFYPAPGNHDLRTERGATYRRAFVWPVPATDPEALHYAFRWGDIQFLALDTTEESGAGPELRAGRGAQLAWLEETLERAHSDSTVRWTIAFMHHPPYSHARGLSGHGSDLELREVLSPLFDRYGVDLVLSGHDHNYERSRPIRGERVVDRGCGPTYVVTGGGGASRVARYVTPSPLTAAFSTRFHFLRIRVLRWAIDVDAIDERGETLDRSLVLPYESQPLAMLCR